MVIRTILPASSSSSYHVTETVRNMINKLVINVNFCKAIFVKSKIVWVKRKKYNQRLNFYDKLNNKRNKLMRDVLLKSTK
jgi:hypothetical protein